MQWVGRWHITNVGDVENGKQKSLQLSVLTFVLICIALILFNYIFFGVKLVLQPQCEPAFGLILIWNPARTISSTYSTVQPFNQMNESGSINA